MIGCFACEIGFFACLVFESIQQWSKVRMKIKSMIKSHTDCKYSQACLRTTCTFPVHIQVLFLFLSLITNFQVIVSFFVKVFIKSNNLVNSSYIPSSVSLHWGLFIFSGAKMVITRPLM